MARNRRTRRRKAVWVIGAAGAAAVLIVAGLLFQPWLLFVDVRVADRIPSPQATPFAVAESAEMADSPTVEATTPVAPVGPRDLAAGSLISHEHETSGSVRVIENPDGTRQVALVGLVTSNGPDVHVWLSAGNGGRGARRLVHRGVVRPRRPRPPPWQPRRSALRLPARSICRPSARSICGASASRVSFGAAALS